MKTKKLNESTLVNDNSFILSFDFFYRIFPDGQIQPTACLKSIIDFDKIKNKHFLFNNLEDAVVHILKIERNKVYVVIPLASNFTIVLTNDDYLRVKSYQ